MSDLFPTGGLPSLPMDNKKPNPAKSMEKAIAEELPLGAPKQSYSIDGGGGVRQSKYVYPLESGCREDEYSDYDDVIEI